MERQGRLHRIISHGDLPGLGDDDHPQYGEIAQAEEITGLWNFIAVGGDGLIAYDLLVGDTTTPDYGMIRMGDSAIGRVAYNAMSMDLDGSVIIRNLTAPATSKIEFAFLESGGTSVRFALATSAVGNATYSARSMLIAGPSVWNDEIVTVGYWQGQGIFDNLACDTAGDGADLGVQNDLEVEGDIFCDSFKESTSGGGITVQPLADSTTFFQIKNAAGTQVVGVDTTNKRVIIGTGNPSRGLEIVGSGASGDLKVSRTGGASGFFLLGAGLISEAGGQFTIDENVIIKTSSNPSFLLATAALGQVVPLGMASANGSFSNIALTGDIIMRTENAGDNVVITARNAGGEIKFGTETPDTQKAVITSGGFFGIGEPAPETMQEITGTAPYFTLHNSTHEDTDGGRESRIIYKGEQSGGEETAGFRFEASHDGTSDDQLFKGVWSVNTGSGLVDVLKIDSTGALQTLFGRIISRTSVTSSPYTILVSDEHISVTTASTAITLNLPAIIDGAIYHIKDQDENSAGKNITVSPDGSDTIENAGSLVIANNGASVTLVGNSTTNNWEVQ